MWELIQWLLAQKQDRQQGVCSLVVLIINQDSHCQVLFLPEKERKPMVPRRQQYMILPHFGAKPDEDSRELVKLDPGAHCCLSCDGPSLPSLFPLPHKLLLPMPPHIPKSSRVEFSHLPPKLELLST